MINTAAFKIGDLKNDTSVILEVAFRIGQDDPVSQTRQLTVLRKEKGHTLVFMQTDKPVYKGGDTVKFRVITVDDKLLPKALASQVQIKVNISFFRQLAREHHRFIMIYEQDGVGNIVAQFLNASDANGKANAIRSSRCYEMTNLRCS